MEGLEVSVINLRYVVVENGTFRIDSSYFQKEFLQSALGNSFTTVGTTCLVRSGTTPPDREDELQEGVILLKTTDVRGTVLSGADPRDFYYIKREIADRMAETKLAPNDVLINIVGATTEVIGRVALVPEDFPEANITQAMALLRVTDTSIKPAFLFAFLLGKYGHQQVRRIARPTGQYNLNLPEVRSFKLPRLAQRFQLEIEKWIRNSYAVSLQSRTFYAQAENVLLDALGLHNWQPPEDLTYEQTSSRAFAAGRLDAEYFQPKYADLFRQMQQAAEDRGWIVENLGNLSSPLKYGTSTELEYLEEGVPFLRIADVRNGEFEPETLKYISSEAAAQEQSASVRVGDVLISRSGTLGLAVTIGHELDGAIFGSYFIRTRPNQRLLNPVFLSLFVNSLIGQLQIEQLNTGGVQTNLTIPAIEALNVPLPSLDEQEYYIWKIIESRAARIQSKRLLEAAKRAVEIAIEDSEAAALRFLEEINAA